MNERYRFSLSFLVLLFSWNACSQDIPPVSEQELENIAATSEELTEDDTWWQEMEGFLKSPLNLNTADQETLSQLPMLSGLQIASLLLYRKLSGTLLNIYELQAVPYWDTATIRKLMPYITVSGPDSRNPIWKKMTREGEHSILLRVSRILEKSKGFDHAAVGNHYNGSPDRIFFRYQYSYKKQLQYGILGDKDAGEALFRGARRTGFDFYSFHFFLSRKGLLQSVALGDYTINIGQGLIQWQGLTLGSGTDIMAIKRQSAIIRPYASAGEYRFFRGAALQFRKNRFGAVLFVSRKKRDAYINTDSSGKTRFSSFIYSGYHRTASEMATRNVVIQTSGGLVCSYKSPAWHIGLNITGHEFNYPFQKSDEPYNVFAWQGNGLANLSLDYSFTYRNLHGFGEAGSGLNFKPAMINGILISADPRVDISLVYRHISPAFQSVYGNAFTANSSPWNERGFFAGLQIRPAAGWRLEAQADLVRFPWLKYRVASPSRGASYLLRLSFSPDKKTEIYTRFRSNIQEQDGGDETYAAAYPGVIKRRDWRLHISSVPGGGITIRARVELSWYQGEKVQREAGSFFMTDLLFHPMLKPYSAGLRLAYFETGGYASRIYAYENDVLYAYAIPAYYGKGYRCYLNLKYKIGRSLVCWIRWARFLYPRVPANGTGLDEIRGPGRTELKTQIRLIF